MSARTVVKRVALGTGVGLVAGLCVANRGHFEAELTHPHKLLSSLQHTPQFTRLQGDSKFRMIEADQGVLGENGGLMSAYSFVDSTQPGHTVSFVYAGSRTVGFPFVVHGGVLGTILDRAMTLSSQESKSKYSKLNITYKSPTFANQFLVVETTPNGAEIRTLKGKLLVAAN